MREKLQAIGTKVVAARHGNPARSLSLLLVAGNDGRKTTIQFLEAILKEAGRDPVVLSNGSQHYDRDAQGFYQALSTIKKSGKVLVIIEVSPRLIESHALIGQAVDTLVITSKHTSAEVLQAVHPKHVVTPVGFLVEQGSVEPYQHIVYGDDEAAEARLESTKLYRHGTELSLTIDHQTKLELATYFAGYANAHNLVAAAATAYVLGVNLEAIQEGIADLEPASGSFFWYATNRPYEVVYDRAESEVSILFALQSAKKLAKRRLIVALDAPVSQDVIQHLKQEADRVFVVSDEVATADIDTEPSPQSAFDKALRSAKREDTVLILGQGFETSITQFEAEGIIAST